MSAPVALLTRNASGRLEAVEAVNEPEENLTVRLTDKLDLVAARMSATGRTL